MTWYPSDNRPIEGEDLILKLTIRDAQYIRTGYYMDGEFTLDRGLGLENEEQYITHYIYSKELL